MNFLKLLSFVPLFGLAASVDTAFAGASGVSFTDSEIAASRANATLISETAASCISRTWNEHLRFYKQRGYSKFYGNRHPKHKTAESRKNVLLSILPDLARRVQRGDRTAIEELDKREKELEATSCIGLAMQCLDEGFEKAGMSETWKKIYVWLGRTGPDGSPLFYGTDLQKALIDLGWKSLYWNPDLSQNEEWDRLEKAFNPLEPGKQWNPVWGGHVYRWSLVLRKKEYYEIPIHDIRTLVNFGISPSAEFKKPPFFIGTAHAGYHVFPGFKGQVIEAHSMRELKSRENLEVGEFNPLYQAVNGIPDGNGAPKWTRTEHYRSGVMVVPPGYIPDKPYSPPPPARDTPPNGTHPPNRDGEPDDDPNGEEEFSRRRNGRSFPPWWR